MKQPENQSKTYASVLAQIDDGYIKIPQFQREFVWNKEQTAKLIDSIIKGFPIGTFIFWKTREELRHIRNVGNAKLPSIPKGDAAQYVLDGQQRITSLYAVRKGLIITKEGEAVNYRDIFIDLSADPDSDQEVVATEKPEKAVSISVHELLTLNPPELVSLFSSEEFNKIYTYKSRLEQYAFSTIVIDDYPIDVACEVFTRINTGGKELTLFEIMVAKTYDQDRDFDLSVEYDRLIGGSRPEDENGVEDDEKDLEDAGYETLPAVTVMQSVAAVICGQITRSDILKIPKSDFIDAWPKVRDGLFAAVDYVRTSLHIPVSRLVPYPALLIPLTYFFVKTAGKHPTGRQNKLLIQWFFWCAFTNRFSSAVESKIAQDLKRIEEILQDKAPDYSSEGQVALTVDDLKFRWFSTGDAFCKAILCIYMAQEPKSFTLNSKVQVDNSWLKASFSKNYHHFFPKAFLKRQEWKPWQANSILNITIVDDFLNKREIKAKPPSQYMRRFQRHNEHIEETMKSHLIDDLDGYGIWEDDYDKFLTCRAKRLLREIQKRIEPKL